MKFFISIILQLLAVSQAICCVNDNNNVLYDKVAVDSIKVYKNKGIYSTGNIDRRSFMEFIVKKDKTGYSSRETSIQYI